MPKVGGKRKKTKTHEDQEELDSTTPTCKLIYILIINFSHNNKKGSCRSIYA